MAARSSLAVASVQYRIERLASLDAIEAKLETWVADAARRGADVILFPEYGAMELAGLHPDAIAGNVAASLAAVATDLPRIDAAHVRLARRHGLHILAASGPMRRTDGRFVNAARLVTPRGRIGAAKKIVMTPFERQWGVVGGGPLRVFETDLGRIGVLVCYDSEFPLLARAQVEAGAEVILIPSCTELLSGFNRVRTAALARALEGTVATVTSPTVGEAPWCPAVDFNSGAAGIYVPAEAGLSDTGVLVEGRLGEAALVTATIDLDRLRRLRSDGEMRNAADWSLQPGAGPLPAAEVVDLR